jgi:hypothetical protein
MPPWLDSLLSGPFAGLLAGLLIALLTTSISLRRQRRSEWQGWLQEAAAEFAMKVRGASTAVEHAILYSRDALRENETAATGEGEFLAAYDERVGWAAHLVRQVPLSLSRVELLFSENPSAKDAARESFEALERALESLEDRDKKELLRSYTETRAPRSRDEVQVFLTEAQKLWEIAEKQEKDFIEKAHRVIREAG